MNLTKIEMKSQSSINCIPFAISTMNSSTLSKKSQVIAFALAIV